MPALDLHDVGVLGDRPERVEALRFHQVHRRLATKERARGVEPRFVGVRSRVREHLAGVVDVHSRTLVRRRRRHRVPLLSGAVKLDVMLSDSIVGAAERARALEQTGVDGVFSFENSHDLFFPLVAAAPECTLDLMTNVAIAFPRSPTHLAHAAYDLHLLLRRPVPPRARHAGARARGEALRRAVGQAGSSDAGVGPGHEGDPDELARPHAARVPRRVHDPHAHDAGVRSRDPTRTGSRRSWSARWARR